jgi:hypothetical protein
VISTKLIKQKINSILVDGLKDAISNEVVDRAYANQVSRCLQEMEGPPQYPNSSSSTKRAMSTAYLWISLERRTKMNPVLVEWLMKMRMAGKSSLGTIARSHENVMFLLLRDRGQ